MRLMMTVLFVGLFCCCCSAAFAADATTRATKIPATQPLSREQWGAPLVDVAGKDNLWTITGRKQTVTLDASDL